jgi:hypothetical protein
MTPTKTTKKVEEAKAPPEAPKLTPTEKEVARRQANLEKGQAAEEKRIEEFHASKAAEVKAQRERDGSDSKLGLS